MPTQQDKVQKIKKAHTGAMQYLTKTEGVRSCKSSEKKARSNKWGLDWAIS